MSDGRCPMADVRRWSAVSGSSWRSGGGGEGGGGDQKTSTGAAPATVLPTAGSSRSSRYSSIFESELGP
eukprot:scaffold122266_cov26-Tisochrysis_lutea.AAC.1